MQDRQRFVQQYVERQQAYVPTYTTENLAEGGRRTPSRDVQFGFDTPVLRPRAPFKPPVQAWKEKDAAPLLNKREKRPPSEGKKDKPRNKRKGASTPIDTDSERGARLADRRERKRRKCAIVNPTRDDDEIAPTTAAKKGKTKKSAALALLYGFSATNVTKDRLTLKPAPSLGVFSKGKASAKKRTSTIKRSSRNELFSESAFLNKSSDRTADDDSDASSTCNHDMYQGMRATNHTKKDRGKRTDSPPLKQRLQAPTHTTAESQIWDIEVQSKLPSSACDISSEPETKASAPVVLDWRGAEWSASINVAREREKRQNKTRTPSLSVIQSRPRTKSIIHSSPLVRSDLGDELCAPHAGNVSSVHPSHSASQVGRCAADTQARGLWSATSKYFVGLKPIFEPGFTADPPLAAELNDGADVVQVQDLGVAELDVQTVYQVVSPTSSPISFPPGLAGMQTPYDMVPDCPCEDCWRDVNVPSELAGERECGFFESSAVEIEGDRFIDDDVCFDPLAGQFEESGDPLAQEYEDDIEEARLAVEPCGLWTTETPVMYEDVDESLCWSEYEGADFLEGRALLRGVESSGWVRVSGLDEAEKDVASRLRYHWRPLRL